MVSLVPRSSIFFILMHSRASIPSHQNRCFHDLISQGHTTWFPGSILISKKNTFNNHPPCLKFSFVLFWHIHKDPGIKNSSWVRKSAVMFVYILLRLCWLDIWYMICEDLSPHKEWNSKFNGFRAGSLSLAPFFSPAHKLQLLSTAKTLAQAILQLMVLSFVTVNDSEHPFKKIFFPLPDKLSQWPPADQQARGVWVQDWDVRVSGKSKFEVAILQFWGLKILVSIFGG